jgi:hypothetical protein
MCSGCVVVNLKPHCWPGLSSTSVYPRRRIHKLVGVPDPFLPLLQFSVTWIQSIEQTELDPWHLAFSTKSQLFLRTAPTRPFDMRLNLFLQALGVYSIPDMNDSQWWTSKDWFMPCQRMMKLIERLHLELVVTKVFVRYDQPCVDTTRWHRTYLFQKKKKRGKSDIGNNFSFALHLAFVRLALDIRSTTTKYVMP